MINFFEGTNGTCMNLFNIANKFKTGVQMHIFKDIDYLKNSLMKIYENIYGYDLDFIRHRLKRLKPMKTVAISDVRHALQTLNIVASQKKYVWLARFYAILPIPEGWEKTEPEYFTDTYVHIHTGEKIFVKPCYYYIVKLLEILKTDPNYDRIWKIWMITDENQVDHHVFEDGFERIILVSNDNLFNYGTTEMVENNKEKAQHVVSKEVEQLNKYTHPVVERINVFLKNQSKDF